MTAEEEKVADDLKWETLEKDKQQEYLTKKVRRKSIHNFLKNDSLLRQRACDYSINRMKYATSQMLDKVNKILNKELKEPTQEDEIDWEEDNLLYDYNSAKVIVAEEVKATELTSEQQEIHDMIQEYLDIVYSNIKDLNQTNIIKHTIKLLDKALIV